MDKNFKAINEPIIDFEPGSKHRELKRLEPAIPNHAQNLIIMVTF